MEMLEAPMLRLDYVKAMFKVYVRDISDEERAMVDEEIARRGLAKKVEVITYQDKDHQTVWY